MDFESNRVPSGEGENDMTATPTVEPVQRVPEVAKRLDCSRDAVYGLIASGELRAIRVGRLLRVPESALADFIAGKRP